MRHMLITLLSIPFFALLTHAEDTPTQWVEYEGRAGPGKGRHIVFVSGDEEYRSEEGMPQLARILATHHGFTCTVLFAIDPETKELPATVFLRSFRLRNDEDGRIERDSPDGE